jgi:hypothetical protein
MANKYLRQHLTPSAATETELYVVPAANNAVLSSLRITNDGAGPATVTVTLYPGGGATEYKLLKGCVIFTGQTVDAFSGVPCVLIAGDELTVTSDIADIDFYLSYLEIDRT